MSKLDISVSYSSIEDKISRNLAIIGKRAKGSDGKALFSSFSVSETEKVLFYDLLEFGAENVVSELSDVASTYVYSDSTNTVTFSINSTRWNNNASEPDLTNALSGLISNYLYNFCIARYLDSTGVLSSFSKSYTEHCSLIIRNIKTLAFLKRESKSLTKSYGSL